MTSSDPNADATSHQYDIHMQTGIGNAIGQNAQVTNYHHYGSSQPQGELEAYFEKIDQMLPSLQENFLGRRNEAAVNAARILTLRTLADSDKAQKRRILLYLYKTKLIELEKPIIDLKGADLRDADLSLADLSKANLREASLREANLHYANLRNADLSLANLYRANLSKANLSKADLHRAYLWGANLSEAHLMEADLSDADLSELSPHIDRRFDIQADLSKAELYRANLSGACLIGANLSGASLYQANLSGASLLGANLSGVNLLGANLLGANLSYADLHGAIQVNVEELEKQAKSLTGAIMLDGSIHR
jgi:uncharacterized protein YjbI with pentapeptide repeats